MRKINEVIVHCSATPEGRDVTVAEIRKWHKARGWADVGYHWVVYLDGSIHAGRPEHKIGAHCKGRNRHTIGVCFIGGMDTSMKNPKDTRTTAQKTALVALLLELKMRHPSIEKVSGHRDYAAKACPSYDATTEYRDVWTAKPAPVPSPVVERLAARGRVSSTELAAGAGVLTTITGGARQIAEDVGGIAVNVPPWAVYALGSVALLLLFHIYRERRSYRDQARQELEA